MSLKILLIYQQQITHSIKWSKAYTKQSVIQIRVFGCNSFEWIAARTRSFELHRWLFLFLWNDSVRKSPAFSRKNIHFHSFESIFLFLNQIWIRFRSKFICSRFWWAKVRLHRCSEETKVIKQFIMRYSSAISRTNWNIFWSVFVIFFYFLRFECNGNNDYPHKMFWTFEIFENKQKMTISRGKKNNFEKEY